MAFQDLIKSIRILRPWQSDNLLLSLCKVKNNKMQASTEENSCASHGFWKYIGYQLKNSTFPFHPPESVIEFKAFKYTKC